MPEFQDFFRNPVVIALNVISLFFVIFHAITWFNLAPKAMAVRMGGKRVPAMLIAGPQYVAWVIVSAVVAWLRAARIKCTNDRMSHLSGCSSARVAW